MADTFVSLDECAALHEAATKVRAQIAELTQLAEVLEAKLKEAMGEATAAKIGDRVVLTYRRNGTFASAKFRTEQPELYAAYLVPSSTLDTKRLAAEHPDVYASYRGRKFEWKD